MDGIVFGNKMALLYTSLYLECVVRCKVVF